MKTKDGGIKIKYPVLKIKSVDDYFLIVIKNAFHSSCLSIESAYSFTKFENDVERRMTIDSKNKD